VDAASLNHRRLFRLPSNHLSLLSCVTLDFFSRTKIMKPLLALAAGWIAFSLADHAIYDGRHVRFVGNFFRAIGVGFGWVNA
jgi:hypothetical protein